MSSQESKAPKAAEPAVIAANKHMSESLNWDDIQDFEDARRGFLGSITDATVRNESGKVVWSLAPYGFIEDEDAPTTVNASLWRQARLNLNHGLFEVLPGLYQVRGLDLANMTLIESDTGVIVVDTLTTIESAKAAIDLYFSYRGRRPVRAIIYTHNHADHWGGARGILSHEKIEADEIPIIAPHRFMEFAVSENVLAGSAMLRRAQYQFGPFLERGPRGHVDCGLGKTVGAGSSELIAPNDYIHNTGEIRRIDGVELVFQMAPESEAPAEFHIYLPAKRALNLAENASHTFHNLLPFRGSEVRNTLAWSQYLTEALELWGDQVEVLVGQHHWPIWGRDKVVKYIRRQRDLYKFLHDQTVRLINHGLKPNEIAQTITLPPSLAVSWPLRGYYGDLRHNSKAIYQRYIGWYDANPVNLNPLPAAELAPHLVRYMGGAQSILERARKDFKDGQFRLVAQVLDHVVRAEPANEDARMLLADSLEQLGYMSESATWRNAYLTGAMELRTGTPRVPFRAPLSLATLQSLQIDQLFTLLGVRVNATAAEGKIVRIRMTLTGNENAFVLAVENSVLTVGPGTAESVDAACEMDRDVLHRLILREVTVNDALAGKKITVTGNADKLVELFSLFDHFDGKFQIVG